MQPAIVALVGVTIAPFVVGKKLPAGPSAEMIEGARVFVLPNPSGLNASFPSFAAKLTWFEKLQKLATST